MGEWNGRTVLITGASSGIGEAFARRLAADGANLILTARSIDKLDTIARELESNHRVRVTTIGADLALPAAAHEIFDRATSSGQKVDLLINNAAFGLVGDFADLPLERHLEMIQVNVTSLVTLTHLFLPGMIGRRNGAVINVSSIASFQGVPFLSLYAATKALITNLSEGLSAECASFGVRVLGLCPGATTTNFHNVAGALPNRPTDSMQSAEDVVDYGLRKLAHHNILAIPGLQKRLTIFFERFAPRSLVTRISAGLYRPAGR